MPASLRKTSQNIQIILQGIILWLGTKQHGIIPVAPMSQRCKQSYGSNHRFAQRQNDLCKYLDIVGSVNLSRFPQGGRNLWHKAPENNDIKIAECTAEYHGHIGVFLKAQGLHTEYIPGGKSRSEDGCEKIIEGYGAAVFKVSAGQYIPCGRTDQQNAQGVSSRPFSHHNTVPCQLVCCRNNTLTTKA